MKKQSIIFMLFCVMALPLMAQNRNNQDEVVKLEDHSYDCVPGQVLVKFTDNSSVSLRTTRGVCRSGVQAIDEVLQQYSVCQSTQLCAKNPTRSLRQSPSYGGGMVVEHDMTKLYKITLDSTQVRQTFDFIEALKALPDVEYAEPNFLVYALGNTDNTTFVETVCTPSLQHQGTRLSTPNDPLYSQQWSISVVGLDSLWTVDTAYAADGSDRPIIAILDTGVDPDHPDLAANIWTNPNESGSNNGVDDDHNGFIDDLHGWDFINQTGDMHDFNSHGTHCAGIAAAVGDNGIGIVGANPHALIMPVSVLQSNGAGDLATIIQGINYAANNGADVISMSFGTYTPSAALEQALGQAYQSAVLVAAAGNDGKSMTIPRCTFLTEDIFPAAYTFVLGVQGSDMDNLRASWSNFDCDGPSFSAYSEEQLYNYELLAPGENIISTVPGGQYRNYNGTSMACPLVAGGISALIHAKNYASKELLFGDIINSSNSMTGIVDFYVCYQAGNAPAQLQLVTYSLEDSLAGDNDNRPDAGETMMFYPTLRTTWGAADSIYYWIEFAEFEDTTLITFPSSPTPFGVSLSSYAKSRAINPIQFQIRNNVVDGRNINLVFKATSPNSIDTLAYNFSIVVENGVELAGALLHDMTLYPNVHYIVTRHFAVASNATLTIKPGTTIYVKQGVCISIAGRLYAVGKPDSLIVFQEIDNSGFVSQTAITLSNHDTLKYVSFTEFSYNVVLSGSGIYGNVGPYIENCIFANNRAYDVSNANVLWNCHFYNNYYGGPAVGGGYGSNYYHYCNFVNNTDNLNSSYSTYPSIILNQHPLFVADKNYTNSPFYITTQQKSQNFFNCNTFSNYSPNIETYYPQSNGTFNFGVYRNELLLTLPIDSSYFGSTKESIIRKSVLDYNHPLHPTENFITVNFSGMAHRPVSKTHGVVWKVLCNGFDAQDEFDSIIPLGVGKHRFDIYFNRAMDVSVTPMVALGVRPPYTQHAIDDDGSWNADSTIYTVYLHLTGTSNTDGLNRIYVANAKDNEHFECPLENRRFNVPVAVAGSMSAGFMATAGVGRINLEWNNNDVNFDDFLGYNIYRFQINTAGVSTDSVLINNMLIQDTTYTDYNVSAGERYYYFYRILRTDMMESASSKVVTAIPQSAILGDANGNMQVDVTDVVTTVSHILGQNPQPFIFDVADVNNDGNVNILDVIGIIRIISHPSSLPSRTLYSATYTIENGILYVDCPVAIGGVQVILSNISNANFTVLETLNGFEHVSKVLPNGNILFLSYSCIGNTIPAGRHALLRIEDAGLGDIILSDPTGTQIETVPCNTTAIISSSMAQLNIGKPYPNPFSNSITIPYSVNSETVGKVDFIIVDMLGRIIDRVDLGVQTAGEHKTVWTPKQNITNGIYFIQMRANGLTTQSTKIVYSK